MVFYLAFTQAKILYISIKNKLLELLAEIFTITSVCTNVCGSKTFFFAKPAFAKMYANEIFTSIYKTVFGTNDFVSILEDTHIEPIMKLLNLCALGITLCLSACSLYAPTYFGSKFTPTTIVQSFYSTKDITRPFEVIGHMNASTGRSEYSQAKTRELVIEKAKQIGGDGVVFSELNKQVNQHTTDDFTIKVEVVKFK